MSPWALLAAVEDEAAEPKRPAIVNAVSSIHYLDLVVNVWCSNDDAIGVIVAS